MPTADNDTFAVDEKSAANTVVGQVVAADVEAGQTLSYAITAGNTGDVFAIDANGQITVVGALDFETTPSYTLTIEVTDNGGSPLSTTATITIDVNDVNDAPTDIILDNNSVDENQLAGALVGYLSGADEDSSDTLTFTLVSGTGEDDNASFAIVDDELQTAEVFDFETKHSYSIRVRVTDADGLWFEKIFTILVSDLTE